MFSREVCDAAQAHLNPAERQALQQEAARRGCSTDQALLAVALENLQRQLYTLSANGRRLVLVKG